MSQTPSNLHRSLARAITPEGADLAAFNDEEIRRAATEHGIGPLLARGISQGRVTGLAGDLEEELANVARNLAGYDLVLNRNTRQLLDLLAENGIAALLLKGTPVALMHYEQPYLRTRCDTDLFIREQDVSKISSLLATSGYTLTGAGDPKYSSKQFVATIATFQQVNSHFDIHWRLSNRVLFRRTLPFGDCWQSRQPVPALGDSAWAPETQDLLLHACIHRIAHGRGTERNRLIWLYDIHLLWKALDEPGKQSFINKALDKKTGTLCADALEVCTSLFKPERAASAATKALLKELRAKQKSEPTAPLINAGKLRWAWSDMMALKGLKAKVTFTKELLQNRL